MAALTQADIDALDRQIADGVRSVTIRGKTVTYNPTLSLIAARNDLIERLNEQLAAEAGRVQGTRTYLHYGGRGY